MADKHRLVERFIMVWGLANARAEKTLDGYKIYLDRLAEWLGDIDIKDATPQKLEEFCGPYLHSLGLKPRSRRPNVSAIKMFYKWLAEKTDVMDKSPAVGLSLPGIGRPLPIPMGLKNAEKLLMAPGMDDFLAVRDTAILALLIGCGPRVTGITRLNESDLIWEDSDKDTLLSLTIKFREKGKVERYVPCPIDAALLLRAYLGHEYLHDVERTLPDGDKVVFISIHNSWCAPHDYYGENRRLTGHSIKCIVRRWGKAAKIPHDQCIPHALRHLYGTELAEGGVDLIERSRLLGHAKPETTAVYTHLAMRRLAATVKSKGPMAKIKTPATGLAQRLGL